MYHLMQSLYVFFGLNEAVPQTLAEFIPYFIQVCMCFAVVFFVFNMIKAMVKGVAGHRWF